MSRNTTTQTVVVCFAIGVGLGIPLGNVLDSIALRLLLGLTIGALLDLAVEFSAVDSMVSQRPARALRSRFALTSFQLAESNTD